MITTKLQTGLRALTLVVCFSAITALPALGAPKAKPMASPAASPAGSPAAAEEKARPIPFKSVVVSVDAAAHTFKMGKKTIRQVHVLPETKLTQGDGTAAATFEELKPGAEVRGSAHKRSDGDYDAVSVKIGPKPMASPAASPTAKPAASPVAKPTAKPVASPVASPTAKPVASPVASPEPKK